MHCDWNIGIIWNTETININWITPTNQSPKRAESKPIHFFVWIPKGTVWHLEQDAHLLTASLFDSFPISIGLPFPVFLYIPSPMSIQLYLWYWMGPVWAYFVALLWEWSGGVVTKITWRNSVLLQHLRDIQLGQESLAFLWTSKFISILTNTRCLSRASWNYSTIKNCVFLDVTPCDSCKKRRFGGT
jgi:hypothetical protein